MITRLKLQIICLILIGVSAVLLFVESFDEEKRLASMGTSMSELYNDRLLAEQAIYRMNDILHSKKNLQLTGQPVSALSQEQIKLSDELAIIFTGYMQTKLTRGERNSGSKLASIIADIRRLESNPGENNVSARLIQNYDNAQLHLEDISDIQIAEAGKIKTSSEHTLAASALGVKLNASLYIIVLISFVAFFKSSGIIPSFTQKHELN